MKNRVIIALILTITFFSGQAQTGGIYLDSAALGQGKIVRKANFDGNSLWGYINGGADIYLEYGFKSLLMHEVEYMGNLIRFDLYHMSDPKAAYGIFSVYSSACDDRAGPGLFNCITRWQIQIVKNEYYLSVILPTGSSDERTFATEVSEKLLSSIEGKSFEPGYPFTEGEFHNIRGVIKYSRGILGIENGIAIDSYLLRDSGFSELWNITGIEDMESISVTALTFSSPERCSEYAARVKEHIQGDKMIILFPDGLSVLTLEGPFDSANAAMIARWFTGLKQ